MKAAAARDLRHAIVHIDVVADNVHRQTTSGPTDSNDVTVLENRASISGYQNHLKFAVTEESDSDTNIPRDRNRKCKSTVVGTLNAENDSVLNDVTKLLPKMNETVMTLSNNMADSNNNRRTYDGSIANNSAEDQLLRRIPVYGKTTSAGSRVRPGRTVATTAHASKTRKQSMSRTAAVHEVASCVRRRPEVLCTVATPGDEEVPTTGSDQSYYSGIYERDLEEILESLAAVNCHLRRRRHSTAAFALSRHQRADKFFFRLPPSPEIQSYRSTSDSCYGHSDSESESERKWTSEDDLDSDEDAAAAFNSGSFFRRLNHFLFNGNRGPEMAAIEP